MNNGPISMCISNLLEEDCSSSFYHSQSQGKEERDKIRLYTWYYKGLPVKNVYKFNVLLTTYEVCRWIERREWIGGHQGLAVHQCYWMEGHHHGWSSSYEEHSEQVFAVYQQYQGWIPLAADRYSTAEQYIRIVPLVEFHKGLYGSTVICWAVRQPQNRWAGIVIVGKWLWIGWKIEILIVSIHVTKSQRGCWAEHSYKTRDHHWSRAHQDSEAILSVQSSLFCWCHRAIYDRNRSFLYKGCKSGDLPSLMHIETQLRKVCNHPFLIKVFLVCSLWCGRVCERRSCLLMLLFLRLRTSWSVPVVRWFCWTNCCLLWSKATIVYYYSVKYACSYCTLYDLVHKDAWFDTRILCL